MMLPISRTAGRPNRRLCRVGSWRVITLKTTSQKGQSKEEVGQLLLPKKRKENLEVGHLPFKAALESIDEKLF